LKNNTKRYVTKASGKKSLFNTKKLKKSLLRSGASNNEADIIVTEVGNAVMDGLATKKIYKHAFRLLKKIDRTAASRYKLKEAILELGPTGFPFEQYVAELMKFEGYKTIVSSILEGKCISHEIDVIAEKKNEYNLIECKFHNTQGFSSDVKVALYIQSRFIDVVTVLKDKESIIQKTFKGWIVTNTNFTEDALKYGLCSGLELISWNYPKRRGLKYLIDESRLYPITCLTALNKTEKQMLLNQNIVLCHTLNKNSSLLDSLNMNKSRRIKVIDECRLLCSNQGGKYYGKE
jgi:hypothetical protein